ncbi:DNA helicase UvrD/REP type [Lasiodiplodia theobromae]|uniref:DNA helicase UvrD/REP type n=1 Tax=Lasiodiplodia theobromae TaxID=45133 RepID=UPI0015C323B2|nr:DNA helicase UvrD/REP type [Lasiodiplodia theobromae]KAF4540873.1 DNA helicase UvrD/REP type [Lasiodiplodia theobromae]
MDALLSGLNDAQRSAVSSPATVLQVLAPPGSGKTKTLTARVAYLTSCCGFKPWNIIVCTFTIKAAREMKERIRGLVGHGVEAKLILGTFHSVARRFLCFYGHHIGIEKNFGIADTSDTNAIIKRIIKRRGYTTEPSVARSRISGLKARSICCDEYAATQKHAEQQEFAAIYSEYEETLKSSNLLDYDDLLLRCADLLRKRPECVSNIQAVLIDEFQDTNHVQYELMRLMAQYQKTITIVGDPDQSIYGFRSAEIKNLKTMQKDYPETVVSILQENYRSGGAILQSAQQVIEQDESRPAKALFATHCIGELPVLRRLPTAGIEASWIVTEIQRSQALTGRLLNYSDYAILLRSAALSRHIETALGKAGIPYRMVGGLRFFDRIEVKLLLDYLRVINRPDHNDALARIINTPTRRIGEATVRNLLEEAEERKVSLWNVILGAAQGNRRPKTKLSTPAEKGIAEFVNIILTSQKKMKTSEPAGCTLLDLISYVMKKLSFQEYLQKSHPEDFDGRWANVQELIAQATDASVAEEEDEALNEDALPIVEGVEQRELSSAEDELARFLANVALSTEVQQEEGAVTEQVTISTIHAAKGLEWPVVFIPAAYEGSIPHSRAEDHDEERRLLYVGMTRAQSLLYLSCPVKNSQKENTKLSPFVSDPKMDNFFIKQGPKFRYTLTQDLARILRRDCPPEPECRKGRELVERIEDDYWPLDGEDVDPETKSWDFFNRATSDEQPSSKRRRPNDYVPVSLTGNNISVTMDRASSFSISNTTVPSASSSAAGFMSAGARMREIEDEAQALQRAEKLLAREHARAQARDDDEGRAREQQRHLDVIKGGKTGSKSLLPPGQGSITSFFGRPAAGRKPEALPDEQVRDAISFVREKKLNKSATAAAAKSTPYASRPPHPPPPPRRQHNQPIKRSLTAPSSAFQPASISPLEGVQNADARPAHAPPRPPPALSRSATDPSASSAAAPGPGHKLRTAPVPGRPARKQYEDEAHEALPLYEPPPEKVLRQRRRPYSFMSSSPPPPVPDEDDGGKGVDGWPGEDGNGCGDDDGDGAADPSAGLVDDVVPAATMHNTSMAKLTAGSGSSASAGRKTLGMRRSVQGWGAGGVNKPFTAPARRKM